MRFHEISSPLVFNEIRSIAHACKHCMYVITQDGDIYSWRVLNTLSPSRELSSVERSAISHITNILFYESLGKKW